MKTMKSSDQLGKFLGAGRAAAAAVCLSLGLSLGFGALAVETEPVSPSADITVREITTALFKAEPGVPADFSNHDLTYLDLSGLNFKGAKLARSDLYG